MKKKIMILICAVVCVSMMLGLSACSINVKSLDENGRKGGFSLEEIVEGVGEAIKNIDFDQVIAEIENRAQELEEMAAMLKMFSAMNGASSGASSGGEAAQAETAPELPSDIDLFDHPEEDYYIEEAAPDAEGDRISDDISSISGSQDETGFNIPDSDELQNIIANVDEYLSGDGQEALNGILEEYNLEGYADAIAEQMQNNPEAVKEFMDSDLFNEILGGMTAASAGGESADAETAAEAPAEESAQAPAAEEASEGIHVFNKK